MALTGSLSMRLEARLTGANDMAAPEQHIIETFLLTLTDGSGADQANNIFSDERTIGAGSSENIDLAGALTNALGATLTFTAIKAIWIVAAAANTNNVIVGGASSNAFTGALGDQTDKIVLGPGDGFMVTRRSAAGLAVIAGTGDIIKVENGGGSTGVTYRIIIIGEA